MNLREENVVDQVLRRIGRPDSPAGMERRILAAVAEHIAARSGERRKWLQRPGTGRPWVYAGALASVVAMMFAISVLHRPNPVSAPLLTAGAVRPWTTTALLSAGSKPLPAASMVNLPRTVSRKDRYERRTEEVSRVETSRGSETLSASYPAPPMPLTEQERLLLRVVHKGDPEELAMLEPEVRENLEAISAAEFQKFFPPAPIQESKQNP